MADNSNKYGFGKSQETDNRDWYPTKQSPVNTKLYPYNHIDDLINEKLEQHIQRTDNPHQVTLQQLGVDHLFTHNIRVEYDEDKPIIHLILLDLNGNPLSDVGPIDIDVSEYSEEQLEELKEYLEERINIVEEEVKEIIDNLSIEELSKRKVIKVYEEEIDDKWVLAEEFNPLIVYYEKIIEDEVIYYRRIILDEESFIPNTYYYYKETGINQEQPVLRTLRALPTLASNREVEKEEGYYPAYEYNENETYYECVYDCNENILRGIWKLPDELTYCGDWPRNTVHAFHNVNGYYYNGNGNKIDFSRFGALSNWYGESIDPSPIWGIGFGYGWNGQYGIMEYARYSYGGSVNPIRPAGYINFRGEPENAIQTVYFLDGDNYDNTAFKSIGGYKVSDELLPYGDNNYKTKYVEVEVTPENFESGKYYTYYQTPKDVEEVTTQRMLLSKTFRSNENYYVIDSIDLVSNKPIYKQIILTEEEFYNNYQIDYYKILIQEDRVEEDEIVRIQLDPKESIYRDYDGNDVLKIVDNNVLINGDPLYPNLTVNSDTYIDKVLENNAEEVYDNKLNGLKLTIPNTAKHGFCSYISFEPNSSFTFNVVNNSRYSLKVIMSGAKTTLSDLVFSEDCQYNLMFLCNGVNVELYIQEIQLG